MIKRCPNRASLVAQWLKKKEKICLHRRHEFNLWSRKIPHALDQLSSDTTFESVL